MLNPVDDHGIYLKKTIQATESHDHPFWSGYSYIYIIYLCVKMLILTSPRLGQKKSTHQAKTIRLPSFV